VTAGLIVIVVVLGVSAAAGLTWRRRNGVLRPPGALAAGGPGAAVTESAGIGPQLGAALGSRATLVQFSTAFCAPCRATRRILTEVAGMIDGVAHVEIDAESRMDLVRSFDVRRTPTVFVLGPDGRIAKRASGQPTKADVIAAIGEVA
jgi:thiol-disulfide isomerase/thioredoxin